MSKPILTSAELAGRWSVATRDLMTLVRKRAVPYFSIAVNPSDGVGPGRKGYRFRLADVEAWEERELVRGVPRDSEPDRTPTPNERRKMALELGWDGVSRLGL